MVEENINYSEFRSLKYIALIWMIISFVLGTICTLIFFSIDLNSPDYSQGSENFFIIFGLSNLFIGFFNLLILIYFKRIVKWVKGRKH